MHMQELMDYLEKEYGIKSNMHTIYYRIRKHGFPYTKMPGYYLFRKSEVDEWIAQQPNRLMPTKGKGK